MPRRKELPANEISYDPKKMDFLGSLFDSNHFARRYDAVVDAVERLPEPSRQIVERLFWEGINQRDLAKEMNVDESTIRYHRDRALELLREELACILEST